MGTEAHTPADCTTGTSGSQRWIALRNGKHFNNFVRWLIVATSFVTCTNGAIDNQPCVGWGKKGVMLTAAALVMLNGSGSQNCMAPRPLVQSLNSLQMCTRPGSVADSRRNQPVGMVKPLLELRNVEGCGQEMRRRCSIPSCAVVYCVMPFDSQWFRCSRTVLYPERSLVKISKLRLDKPSLHRC